MANPVDTRTIVDQAAVDAAVRWFVDLFIENHMRERALIKLLGKKRSDTLNALYRWLDDAKTTTVDQRAYANVVGILIEDRKSFHGALVDVADGYSDQLFIADDRSFGLLVREIGPSTLCRR
jgi:hypothetical protein